MQKALSFSLKYSNLVPGATLRSNMAHRYFIINKPYNMVSQFVSSHEVRLLGELNFNFPEGTHAVGRLDNHSEGLLILTTNKKVTRLLFLSAIPHKRTYLVQVNNVLSKENLHLLKTGITIKIKGGEDYITPACEVAVVENPATVYGMAAITNDYGPHTWLLITLTEGKFHQVRKMIGAIHHRCKRLIRVSIENLSLGDLEPGGTREMDEATFFRQLNLVPSQKTE